jgi:Carboxypeptidase regulatory-like domain/TonB dependent receptor
MRVLRLVAILLSLGMIGTFNQIATAQSVYGSVIGVLTNIAGVPIVGAKVAIASVGKGTRFDCKTDSSGYYAFGNVPPDDYSLRIEATGYKSFENPLVTVYADNSSVVNPKLAQGNPSELITGSSADVSILKLDRTDISTILSKSQIAGLPLLEQNISNLQVLAPGAIPVTTHLPGVQNPQGAPFININGQNFSGIAYQLDGTDNRDPLEGTVVINPNQDAVGEMKITTQNYSAEFGEATSGVVATQTKSGSNLFHGSAFGYRQSSWGEASFPDLTTTVFLTPSGSSSPIAETIPPEIAGNTLKRNQFGGSIGGPIIKNKLFFFADYRGIRDSYGATLNLTVPTALVRNTCGVSGITDCDLSEYGIPLNTAFTNPNPALAPPNNQVVDPNDPSGMKLLNSSVSPQMVYLMSLLPMPTTSGITNNFQTSGSESFNSDNADVRLDYDANRVKLYARYTYDRFRQVGTPAYGVAAGGPGTNPDLFAGKATTPNQSGAAGFSYSLSPSLSTDFRFGYLRYHLDMDAPDFGTNPLLNASSPNAVISGLNDPRDIYSSDMPDIQITNNILLGPPGNQASLPATGDFLRFGYSNGVNNCNCPLREHEQQFQIVDNWTWMKGHHAIRFGGDFRHIENFRLQSTNPGVISSARSGFLQFTDNPTSPSFTGLGLGDFLTGTLAFFNQTYSDPTNPNAFTAQERQNRAFFFGEDTWHVTSRLTLNYGLRWELYLPQSVNQGAGGFLVVNNNQLPSITNTSINIAGANGVNSQGSVQPTYKNFGPRFGIAYLIGPKTVIRAGYGRSFDVGYAGSLFGIAATENPPVAGYLTIRAGSGNLLKSNSLPPSLPPFAFNSNFVASNTVDVSGYAPSFSTFQTDPTVLGLCLSMPANYKSTGADICAPGAANAPKEGVDLYALPSRVRVPTVDAWNVTVQHQLRADTYFEIAYVGNKGTHVLTDTLPFYNVNNPAQGVVGITANNPYCSNNPNTVITGPYCAVPEFSRTPLSPWIYPVYYFGNTASDNYNALEAKFNRTFHNGTSFFVQYSYSKALDYDSQSFATNPGASYAPGDFDRTHSLAVANVWALPIGRGKLLGKNMGRVADKILGGWSLNGITTWYSGLPFTPTYAECSTDLKVDSPSLPLCIANKVGSVTTGGSRSQFFTTTSGASLIAFNQTTAGASICGADGNGNPQPGAPIGPWQRPGCGQIGNAGRNSLRGPQWFDSDASLVKQIPITERVAVRFRADAFNIFNKVNLGIPDATVDDVSHPAGAITTLATGAIQRQFQFSASVQF